MIRWPWLLGILLLIAGCDLRAVEGEATLEPLPASALQNGVAAPRLNGLIGTPTAAPPPLTSTAAFEALRQPPPGSSPSLGPITLDFADTDIREVATQILGSILRVNFSIDPTVKGTATLHTATPMTRAQLVATLQSLLAANGATMVETGGLFRVVPVTGGPGSLATSGDADSTAVALRYASAEELAKVLQPFLQSGGRIAANPGSNSLIVVGDPATRQALIGLIRAFDIDTLAGQSYALFPVSSGDVQATAAALQVAFRSQNGGALANVVRVVPMQTVNSVMVIASQRSYIEDARRVFTLLDAARRQSVRSWHVYYLQNSRSNDVAFVLQQAFTPGRVTAVPTPTGTLAPGSQASRMNSGGGGGGLGGGGLGSGARSGRGSGLGTGGGLTGGATTQQGTATTGQAGGDNQAGLAADNPLLGGLGGQLDQSDTSGPPTGMRIIPNNANNAILIYGTYQEVQTAETMLRKIDILPLQVMIEAVIAEVTLNDELKYGTQFFFKSQGVNVILSNATGSVASLADSVLSANFPGLVGGGPGAGGAPFVISALQAVTKVKVLSSPHILVLDNHPARLQVGSLVPYLTQSGQSTITPNAPIINSIDYRETGVITEVTPRVNSGGLVTLDVSQEVSNIDPTAVPTNGINSPTFFERAVQSRVVVQDGQTIGLAGLIQDTVSRGNQGIPWLKDIPLLGALAGTQDNSRTRTELLVLITPRVIHDQRDARAATEELRAGLANAALVPQTLQSLKPSGMTDPGARVRQKLQLGP